MKDEAIDGINLKISSVGNVEDVTLLGTLKDAGSNEKVSEFSVADQRSRITRSIN